MILTFPSRYPVGHPEIITENFKDVEQYFGLIKCKVLPPRGLFHPVLPYRFSSKLLFPLCRVCCESSQQETCQHADTERAIIGTWVTEEVKKAIEMGYVVTKVRYFFNDIIYFNSKYLKLNCVIKFFNYYFRYMKSTTLVIPRLHSLTPTSTCF